MQRPSRRRVLSAASAAVLLATFGAAAVGHADAPVSNRSSLKQDL
ncbi:MAG: twin-arginine translocation signal domain-containing protein, partial [Kribbellaceae bacterium]|nr:twin-arginine translocation signal domain-containing protein [Kribbellaceae bacterium]